MWMEYIIKNGLSYEEVEFGVLFLVDLIHR